MNELAVSWSDQLSRGESKSLGIYMSFKVFVFLKNCEVPRATSLQCNVYTASEAGSAMRSLHDTEGTPTYTII